MDDGSQTLPPAGAITVPGAAVVEAPISATTVATTTVAATAAAAATATATGVQATGTPFRLGNRPPLTGGSVWLPSSTARTTWPTGASVRSLS